MTAHSKKTSSASVTSSPASLIQMPPSVTVPSPPDTYDPNGTADYRTAQPKKAELASLGDASKELSSFSDYAQVLGRTAPPAAHVSQALDTVVAWSTLLAVSTLWFNYVRSSAAAAWKDARGLIEGVKVPFDLASTQDPTLSATYPALTRLLGVSKAIAQKSASTKKLNAKDVAEGRPPSHGSAGKKARKLAALTKVSPSASPPSPPAAEPAAPVPAAPPAAVTNGTAHS